MLKILYRTVIILLAASLIGAGIYFATNTGSAPAANPQGMERGRHNGQMPPAGMGPEGDFHAEGGHSQVDAARGLAGVIGNLGLIALITAGVLLAERAFRFFMLKIRKSGRTQTP